MDLNEEYLTPAEVGAIFRVDPTTVTQWAKRGKIPFIMTLGGHRRYPASAVHKIMESRRLVEEVQEEAERRFL